MSEATKSSNKQNVIDNLKSKLLNDVFGQDEAVNKVTDKLLIYYNGLGDEGKPIGSFIFTGPTGVGKTELAKSLAKNLDMNLIRFDMSEYTSEHSLSTLIGGAAGLVGYDSGGLLTNAVLKNPKSILLFDEIEKADKKVLNIFLQILDYGILTSTKGAKVSFRESIIIFTSNVGAISSKKRTIGFSSEIYFEKDSLISEYLSPELRARINTHIDFNPLDNEMSKLIAKKYLNDIVLKLRKKNISIEFSEEIVDYISELSKDGLGARNIHNLIESNIKVLISQKLMNRELKEFDEVFIGLVQNYFMLVIKERKMNYTDYEFLTADEAYDFARSNIGTIVTRSQSGIGFVIKNLS